MRYHAASSLGCSITPTTVSDCMLSNLIHDHKFNEKKEIPSGMLDNID